MLTEGEESAALTGLLQTSVLGRYDVSGGALCLLCREVVGRLGDKNGVSKRRSSKRDVGGLGVPITQCLLSPLSLPSTAMIKH